MLRRVVLGLAVIGLSVGTAQAATIIDFDSNPAPSPVASFTVDDVTFSAVGGGGALSTVSDPNTTLGILDFNSPRKLIRADIAGGTSFVSVDLGDFNADPDTLYLEVFNALDVSLGVSTLLTASSDSSMHTLSLSASNIAYAIFGGLPPSLGGNSVYADNFTYESTAAAVPEPASLVLLGTGLFGLASRARRRARR